MILREAMNWSKDISFSRKCGVDPEHNETMKQFVLSAQAIHLAASIYAALDAQKQKALRLEDPRTFYDQNRGYFTQTTRLEDMFPDRMIVVNPDWMFLSAPFWKWLAEQLDREDVLYQALPAQAVKSSFPFSRVGQAILDRHARVRFPESADALFCLRIPQQNLQEEQNDSFPQEERLPRFLYGQSLDVPNWSDCQKKAKDLEAMFGIQSGFSASWLRQQMEAAQNRLEQIGRNLPQCQSAEQAEKWMKEKDDCLFQLYETLSLLEKKLYENAQ